MRAFDRLVTALGFRRSSSHGRAPIRVSHASNPLPLSEAIPLKTGGWRRHIRKATLDAEVLLLGGVLAALLTWFIWSTGPLDVDMAMPKQNGRLVPTELQTFSFAFVSPSAKLRIEPASEKIEPSPPSELKSVEQLQPPAVTSALAEHVLPSVPAFDPLGAVVFSGLPASTRFSAGVKVPSDVSSAMDWAVPFGDLDNLVIELPRDRNKRLKTSLDLRTRTGARITFISIEIRESQPPRPVARPGGTANRKAKVLPAKSSQAPAKKVKKNVSQPSKPAVAPVVVDPEEAPKVAVPVAQPTAPPGLLSALPFLFFNPDPKDSAYGGLPPHLRDDPRFTTLRGLGMPPIEPPPEPTAEPTAVLQ